MARVAWPTPSETLTSLMFIMGASSLSSMNICELIESILRLIASVKDSENDSLASSIESSANVISRVLIVSPGAKVIVPDFAT